MRMLRRGLNPTRSLSDFFFVVLAVAVAVVVGTLLALPKQATAQSPSQSQTPPPAEQEWSLRDGVGFRSRNLPIGPIFPVRVDGRTLSPTWSSDRSSSSGSSRASDGDTPPLDPKIQFEAEYANKPIGVMREMRVDPKRRAVRILDIFTNTDSQERHVRLDYNTSLSERGNVRYGGVLNQAGESREYGNGLPENTVAALIFAERPDSKALPLFVWGQATARWPVNIQDAGSSASLSYEGTIPAKGKVALLHWVAVAGLDKGVKLERTADLFWKDGRLVDPMVPADIAPVVVNFTPDALKATAVPAASLTQAAGRLVKLEELCGKLSIAREEKDVLWMGKDEHFRGEVAGAGVQLKTDTRTLEIPLAGIAAIRGGGGRGREHRVYLRNGAVLTGRALLRDCRLAGELGELTLDAEALELLLMRVNAEDGKVPPSANGFAELQNGAVHWLVRQDAAAGLQLVTVFGGLPVSFSELWLIERRTEPPFNLVATLAEGSRVHGVAQQPTLDLPVLDADGKVVSTQVRMADMVRFGAGEVLAKEMALPGGESPTTGDGDSSKPKSPPPSRYCWLRDGSLLVGTLTQPSLSVRTGGNEVEVKSEDIARMTLDAANGHLASIELRSGAKMQGELVSESVGWQLGTRTVNLPAGWILELVRKEPDAPSPSPADASAGRNPGENDPLALPKGVAKEDLIEMKVDYPKATAEGPLRISGSVSLPRLDKCDEESVKKRLTFMVPKGTINAALKRPVTVSAPDTAVGVLTNITDGSAKDDGGEHVALEGGLQWVQVDLGEAHHIWKVLLWHYHRMPVVYRDVVVMVSSDPEFRKEVKVIFNNDHDNSSGLGAGPDIAYVETNYGWLMDGMGAQGRYVRFYSNGNSYSEKNDYLEAMVFGTPVTPRPAPNNPLALPSDIPESEMVKITPIYPLARSAPVAPPQFEGIPNLEPYKLSKLHERYSILMPKGTVRVSAGKPVTTSDRTADSAGLKYVTDGNTPSGPAPSVQLATGLQWVQIDLESVHRIWKILLWHDVQEFVVYQDVIVQVSNDPQFLKDVVTLFNNDHDNTSGKGVGSDPAYIETKMGRLIDGGGHRARYVRFSSRGNSKDMHNRYVEAAVYGIREDAPPPAVTATNEAAPTTANDPLAVPKRYVDDNLIEVTPVYPKPFYTMEVAADFKDAQSPHLEKLTVEMARGRVSFRVPKWSTNAAKRRKVTSSAPPLDGTALDQLVDGDISGTPGAFLTLPAGPQWVQIDLGARHYIWKVLAWHDHRQPNVTRDVVVQVSDDAEFKKGVQILFNNDHDNTLGFGKGPDPAYVESSMGRLMDGCNARARYVRLFSNGGTMGELNRYTEVMVYAKQIPTVDEAPESAEPPLTESQRKEREEKVVKDTNFLLPTYPRQVYSFSEVKLDKARFPHLEDLNVSAEKARLKFAIPADGSGGSNVRCKVTCSVPGISEEKLKCVVNSAAYPSDVLELPAGLQWVQIDLGQDHRIWKMLVWHQHETPAVYQDVVIQVSSDPDFKTDVLTVFNNDHDNSSGLGKGSDPAYVETSHGRLINARGAQGRYVRLYSHGNSEDGLNRYNDVRVYGAPEVGASNEPPRRRASPKPVPESARHNSGPSAPASGSPPPATPPTSTSDSASTGSAGVPPAPAPASSSATSPPNDPNAVPKGFTSEQLEEVKPRYPKPMYIGHWRYDEKKIPNLERLDVQKLKERVSFRIPKGARVVSNGAKVTASVSEPVAGTLDLVTNEDARGVEANCVELGPGLQWLQVDLGAGHHLWKVLLWHDHHSMRAYFDVVVQVSDDPEFKKGVQTIFNNDHDNSARLGAGSDPVYLETCWGRLIDGCGATARHLRFYSNGNTGDEDNHYLEIQVYGTPVLASAS